MAKHKLAYALPVAAMALGAGVLTATSAFATTNVDLESCTEAGNDQTNCFARTIDQLQDGLDKSYIEGITVIDTINIDKDRTIDTTGKTIQTLEGSTISVFSVSDGAKLTISGDGEIIKAGNKGNAFEVSGEGSVLELNGGTVSTNAAGKAVYGVYLLGGGKVVVNDGATIDTTGSTGAALSGNNTTGDAHMVVNGGTLKSRYPSVYMAGQVDLTINGGSLEGGIFARMGQIEINGGTITGIKDAGDVDALVDEYATSAMVWTGDAIAVYGGTYTYKHETLGNSLNLTINGGTLSATNGNAVAIYDMGKVAQQMTVNINGGTFDGGENAAVATHWIKDAVASPKAGYGEIKNDISLTISGGTYATEPAEEDIVDSEEAEKNDDGTWSIVPKQVDLIDRAMGADENSDVLGAVEFGKSLIADRKATLNIVEADTAALTLDATKAEANLVKAIDIKLLDRDGAVIPVSDNEVKVYLELSAEEYAALAEYSKVVVIYFDENGAEAERIDAELYSEESAYWIEFTTSHFSTYGIAGVNEEAAAASTPETGTVTAAGASAMSAGIVTAAAVAVIATVAGVTMAIKRK